MTHETEARARRRLPALIALAALAAAGMLGGGAALAQGPAADGGAGAQDEDLIFGGSVEAGREKSTTCAACHGVDGNSVAPEWPSLAGQHPTYIYRQLQAYRNGERQDPAMVGFASMLSEQDMRDLAAYFSVQKLTPKGADPELVGLGEDIYRGGIPERGIPACTACHGPAGHGNYLAAFPRIGGQHSAYMLKTLHDYAEGARRSDADYNQMMRNVADQLLEDEMRAVVSYVQGLRR
ncbi:MAG TPA: c-type cytochrome [Gammaproteobacteria bacterium]